MLFLFCLPLGLADFLSFGRVDFYSSTFRPYLVGMYKSAWRSRGEKTALAFKFLFLALSAPFVAIWWVYDMIVTYPGMAYRATSANAERVRAKIAQEIKDLEEEEERKRSKRHGIVPGDLTYSAGARPKWANNPPGTEIDEPEGMDRDDKIEAKAQGFTRIRVERTDEDGKGYEAYVWKN